MIREAAQPRSDPRSKRRTPQPGSARHVVDSLHGDGRERASRRRRCVVAACIRFWKRRRDPGHMVARHGFDASVRDRLRANHPARQECRCVLCIHICERRQDARSRRRVRRVPLLFCPELLDAGRPGVFQCGLCSKNDGGAYALGAVGCSRHRAGHLSCEPPDNARCDSAGHRPYGGDRGCARTGCRRDPGSRAAGLRAKRLRTQHRTRPWAGNWPDVWIQQSHWSGRHGHLPGGSQEPQTNDTESDLHFSRRRRLLLSFHRMVSIDVRWQRERSRDCCSRSRSFRY